VKTPVKILIAVALVGLVAGALTLKNQNRPAPAVSLPAPPAGDAAATQRLPKLLDLGATKCIPCKKMAPILEELKKEYAGRMEVEFIDVWQNPDAGNQYGIRLIPTQIFFDATGKELFRHEGFYGREDILGKWKELGVKF
jgi:thioredoxin 1